MIQRLTAQVDASGHLSPLIRQQIAAWLTGMADKAVIITLDQYRPKCSRQQRGYHWAVVVPRVAEATGYTEQEAHDAMRVKFLSTEDPATGLTRVRSTEELTTKERAEFTDAVVLWMAEFFHVIIPPPEPDVRKRGTR